MWKRVLLSVFFLIASVAVLGGVKGLQIGAMVEAGANAPAPSASVTVATSEQQTWKPIVRAVGSVVAVRGVTVSTEVNGIVTHIGFRSGQRVRKGEILVRLDASIERAQLTAAEAQAELAEVNLERAKDLARRNINAKADLDTAEANAKQARAQVANIRAQLAKKTIRAPFSGRVGIRKVDLGQILAPGNPIVGLQQTDDVYVDFYLPQRELGRVQEGQKLRVRLEGNPSRPEGEIQTIEPSIDTASRNVAVRALLKNGEDALRPGMFVEVEVVLPDSKPVIVVPATSVVYAPYGNSVYRVDDGEAGGSKVAHQVFVQLGERRGDFVAITQGLGAGVRIVETGAFKLKNGMNVNIQTSKAIEPKLAPTPEDS